jgi:uncharacterized membrane protein
MAKEKIMANLGMYLYGASAVALGIIGLTFHDFATTWQRVPADVPHRTTLALAAAVCELALGAAMLVPRTARAASLLLTLFYMLFVISWLARVAAAPSVWDGYGNVFEEFSLVSSGLVLFAWLSPAGSAWSRNTAALTRLYGLCPISFGLTHFIYFSGAASWVPRWIPPSQSFWVAATGTFFLMAAAAILSGILATLAARLLTAMIVAFEVLVWVPKLIAAPHDPFNWAGNGICVALAAAAWAVSDVLSALRCQGVAAVSPAQQNVVRMHPQPATEIGRPA